jgi:succinate dehydrogenase / fumarate reductase cytochrome b subunit
MSRLGNFLASSVGKKIVLGLTGLLLVGFLVEHLLGNLKLVEDPSGEGFDEYVTFLRGFGPLLLVAEVGLALLFLAHVYLALRLTLENVQARSRGYRVRARRGGSTVASLSMFYTGALLLAYLVKHLLDFRFDSGFLEDPSGAVRTTLSRAGPASIYLLASIVVGVHLSHGFQSALQSLGVSHRAWNSALIRIGRVVAFLLAAGFATIPAYFLFSGGESS